MNQRTTLILGLCGFGVALLGACSGAGGNGSQGSDSFVTPSGSVVSLRVVSGDEAAKTEAAPAASESSSPFSRPGNVTMLPLHGKKDDDVDVKCQKGDCTVIIINGQVQSGPAVDKVPCQAGCTNPPREPAKPAAPSRAPCKSDCDAQASSAPVAQPTAVGSPAAGSAAGQSSGPADVQECARRLGVAVSDIDVVGANFNQKIKSGRVVFVKLDGNQSKVTVDIEAENEQVELKGFCAVLAGNQPHLDLKIKSKVKSFVYIGTGNQSEAALVVEEAGNLMGGHIDLSGNQSKVDISGNGKCGCSNFTMKGSGNQPGFTCRL